MSTASKSIRITSSSVKLLAEIAAVTGLEPEDIVNASIGSVAKHVRENGTLRVPFDIPGANQIPVPIGGELRQRLEAAALRASMGHSSTWLAGLLVEYGLKELERGELRVVQQVDGKGLRSIQALSPSTAARPTQPAQDLPKLRPGQTKRLMVAAELLNLRPQLLVDCEIGSTLDDWFDPGYNSLRGFAESALEYPNDEERQRVISRIDAWMDRRRARAARGNSAMESGVDA